MSGFDDVGWVSDFDVCTDDPEADGASNGGENGWMSATPYIDQKDVEQN